MNDADSTKQLSNLARAIAIRDASDNDMNAVQAIYARHVLHGVATFEEVPPSVEELSARRANIRQYGLPFLVAEFDGAVAGYAYAGPYHARSAYRYTIEDSIYVAEGLGRRGIGRALLNAVIARCEAGPWRQMVAMIGDSANAASISLHRSMGFEMIGTLRSTGFKFGRWVDAVVMQRALGAGDAILPDESA